MAGPTIEEVKKMFQAAGFAVNGKWEEKSEQQLGIPGVLKESQQFLKTAKVLIEDQIARDKHSIVEAHLTIGRLEHGGGC